MLRVKPGPPVDYRLCDQTVTIYHQTGAGSAFGCTRAVFNGAFLDFKKTQTVDKTGSREANSFLLVLPSGWAGRPVWAPPEEYNAMASDKRAGRFTLAPGDKVVLGEGPELTDRAAWAAFVPARHTGLVVLKDVDPKFWRGAVTHVEGGG